MNFLLLIGRAFAQESKISEDFLENKTTTVGSLVTELYKWAIPLGTALAVLVMIYAGYIYITSQGNPDSVKTAKDLIIGALVGLALIILAGVIMRNVIGGQIP